MSSTTIPSKAWFAGASYGGTDNQLERFLSEGIWDKGEQEGLSEQVLAMQPGERIAIKAAYTRKHHLPFDNRGHFVSVLAIKAVGTIIENPGDGRHVRVAWQKLASPKEWFFYTNRQTLWCVQAQDWITEALLAFTFADQPQDIPRFCNEPFWRERFGQQGTTAAERRQRFQWTAFYEAVAEKLLTYAQDRSVLVAGIHEIAGRVQGLGYLQDRFADGSSGPLQDICPFTVIGTFNRSMTDANRRLIAAELAKLLDVKVPVPDSFEGIPVLNNQRSWFFGYATKRGAADIEVLWQVFVAASQWISTPSASSQQTFIQAYNNAISVWGVAWNLSTGLYWAHPWDFMTLDSQSRYYIEHRLELPVLQSGQSAPCDADRYLQLLDILSKRFGEENYPVHSYPDLSLAAWGYEVPAQASGDTETDEVELAADGLDVNTLAATLRPYTLDDVVQEGCFWAREELERWLTRLRSKKNLILQGPPGTGKTWLAKRLAFALMGHRDTQRLRAVQFHPNLSYEEFVRGWRPHGKDGLQMCDGVFMTTIKEALKDPTVCFVVVIEEINRGNPAQILGEMLTLLEASKRTPHDALELSYPEAGQERQLVYIPENVYVIGTMNLADRSLALVDLALRRRFAFVALEPQLGPLWRAWVTQQQGIDATRAVEIEQRLGRLNDVIAKDPRLGKQFCIGHSYVTPVQQLPEGQTVAWFQQVVQTEIGPLLDEYWFDAPEEAARQTRLLLQDW